MRADHIQGQTGTTLFLHFTNYCSSVTVVRFEKIIKHDLEYNIQVLIIEMTGRKPLCIRVQITAVTSAFYFMPVLCVLYSKTLKR